MKKKHNGFTLMEQLTAIIIGAIIVAVALPAYKHYRKKAEFTEVILATSPIKTAFELCVQLKEIPCERAMALQITSGDGEIKSVSYADSGFIEAKNKDDVTYILKASPTAHGVVRWSVSGTCKILGFC